MLTPQDLFPEYYAKLAGFIEEREQQRRKYKPATVRVLFIGESMPAGGDFFYYADSGLYKYTQEAFARVFGSRYGTGERFLEFFKQAGCYLDDLCPVPVNKLPEAERYRIQRQSIPLLAERLQQYDPKPERLVIVMKDIAPEVKEAAHQAGLSDVETVMLPFPGQWPKNRDRYIEGIVALIQNVLTTA